MHCLFTLLATRHLTCMLEKLRSMQGVLSGVLLLNLQVQLFTAARPPVLHLKLSSATVAVLTGVIRHAEWCKAAAELWDARLPAHAHSSNAQCGTSMSSLDKLCACQAVSKCYRPACMPSPSCLFACRADAKQSETDYENLRAEVKVLNQIIERLQGVEADNQRMAAEAEKLRCAVEALQWIYIRRQSRSTFLQAGTACLPASVHAAQVRDTGTRAITVASEALPQRFRLCLCNVLTA